MFTFKQVNTDTDFMDWLLDIIKMKCHADIKVNKLVALNNYIIDNNIFNLDDKQKRSFNLYREMIKVARNLKWRKIKDYYIIYVPSIMFISNTNIPLSRLSRFVCYGDLQVKGYPILSDTIQRVIANIAKYINHYEKFFYGGI